MEEKRQKQPKKSFESLFQTGKGIANLPLQHTPARCPSRAAKAIQLLPVRVHTSLENEQVDREQRRPAPETFLNLVSTL